MSNIATIDDKAIVISNAYVTSDTWCQLKSEFLIVQINTGLLKSQVYLQFITLGTSFLLAP